LRSHLWSQFRSRQTYRHLGAKVSCQVRWKASAGMLSARDDVYIDTWAFKEQCASRIISARGIYRRLFAPRVCFRLTFFCRLMPDKLVFEESGTSEVVTRRRAGNVTLGQPGVPRFQSRAPHAKAIANKADLMRDDAQERQLYTDSKAACTYRMRHHRMHALRFAECRLPIECAIARHVAPDYQKMARIERLSNWTPSRRRTSLEKHELRIFQAAV
jgi:hypothetical protein